MLKITTEQLRAAYDALGLDPVQWDHTNEIVMTPSAVIVRVMDSPRRVTEIDTVAASTAVYHVGKPGDEE